MRDFRNPKIFVVEDNTFYSTLITHELAANGFSNVSAFYYASDFLKALHQMPDIVLLDYHIGDENGLEILKQIKAHDPNIQVIFISGQDALSIATESLKYGAFDYIEKGDKALKKMNQIIGRVCFMNEEIEKKKQKQARYKAFKKAVFAIIATVTTFWLLN